MQLHMLDDNKHRTDVRAMINSIIQQKAAYMVKIGGLLRLSRHPSALKQQYVTYLQQKVAWFGTNHCPTNWFHVNFNGHVGMAISVRLMMVVGPMDLLRAISEATDNYHDGNIITKMGSGKVLYKGKFTWDEYSMDIAVWRFDRQYRDQFRSEIENLTTFKHDNISSICELGNKDENDDDQEHLIIYKHAIHGNLQGHLKKLTWSRRLQICLGVARALNYIHNEGYIHCDINSSKILLADDWEPKIFGFELCTKYLQSWKRRLHLGSSLDTTSVMTPKYDVYLYGELLFEVLCGMKLEFDAGGFDGKIDDIIDSCLRKHLGSQSMQLFESIAKNCLEKKIVERRPSMNQIVKELEEALELEKLLECSFNEDEGTSSNRTLMKLLEIPLSELESATKNFDKAYMVGRGGFSKVYRAELDVLDIHRVSSIIGESKDELPTRKIKTDVAIKRLSVKGDEKLAKQSFRNEIKLLVRCEHPNVVSLRGFCIEANEMILVCEFAKKESLGKYLRRGLSLTWSQRLQICLDVAHGINYLHTNMEGKARIIHRDIKSDNILLDENLNAKVSDLGLSRFHYPTGGEGNSTTIITQHRAGTKVYMDPEYRTTSGYKKESDIYSFGVVLFEVLSGKRANDETYLREHDDGLGPVVRERFETKRMKDLIDNKMFEEDDEHTFTLNRGPTPESLDLFSNIGYECLAKTRAKRPKMEDVIQKLEEASKAQGETMVLSRFRLSSIEDATQNFANENYVGLDAYGSTVYKGRLLDQFKSIRLLATKQGNNNNIGESPTEPISVAIKRITGREHELGEKELSSEIEMHARYKHVNIVPLLGFCYEGDNMLLVYEHGSDEESLDEYLRVTSSTDNMTCKYTWIERLNLCLKIARGLNHLHTLMDLQGKQEMIRVDLRSANILLGKSGEEARITYFGFSKLLPAATQEAAASTDNTVRTKVYCCPEYQKTGGEPNKQSDVYSFGVVLFEIFCGRLAYDPVYTDQNSNGLALVARQCFSDGTIKKMIDPALKEQTLQEILTSKREPILDSLDTYLGIANQCLAENQAERPTMQSVIEELERALNIQENFIKGLQISFKDVQSATGDFSQMNCFGSGRYWKAYKGELQHSIANLDSASASASGSDSDSDSDNVGPTASDVNANTDFNVVAKRWDSKSSQGDQQFRTELSIIIRRKHENIIGLVGYCDEMDERIIVYEPASKGSLDMYLNDAALTWMKRVKICTDVARALKFLHGGDGMLKKVLHGNIQSPAVLLNDDWKAKLSNLEMSSLDSLQLDMEHVSNITNGALGYLNPEYEQGYLTEQSDIYSFGVVMFEILCGRLAWSEGFKDHFESLGPLAKMHHKERKLNEMVFEGIKEEIGPDSMAKYADIASQCLHNIREKRPTAAIVVSQLKKVLDLQEDHERWLAKLSDHRKIVQMAVPKIDAKGKDLYNILCKGIFIDEGKLSAKESPYDR
uniref:uncharacterized protein LOC122609294 n=1 Tax=Erigeron canadensis TaxID=72917 RepID=UPI001CB9952F|nr:uncharacterized protein LOC122609294 [Erigeron canadensis]